MRAAPALLSALVLSLALLPGGARAAFALTPAPLPALLTAALEAELSADLPKGARIELALPEGTPETAFQVIELQADLARGRFAARIDLPGHPALTLQGRMQALVPVPVPLRNLRPGEQLTAADFTFRDMPLQALAQGTLLDLSDIAGRESRRLLPEGRPLQPRALQEPRVIRRGEKLDLIYVRGGLRVTAAARALEDAPPGASLRVQNLSSGRIVTGQALSDGRVEISR